MEPDICVVQLQEVTRVEDESFMNDKLYEAARVKDSNIPCSSEPQFILRRTPDEETNNVLHIAARYGNQGFIKNVLERFPDHHYELLCKHNSKGETPLHLAAQFGHKNTVEALLAAHQRDHHKKLWWSKLDEKGDTPLHRALRYRHEEIALLLLERDIGLVSRCNNAGESPAYLAAEGFCFKFLDTILEGDCYDQNHVSFGGPLGRTVFHPATKLPGDIMLVLIKKGGDMLKVQDKRGKTVLHYAVEEKREPIVKILLEAKSSLAYLRDDDGLTPLHRAANLGSSSMVRIILELSPQSILVRTSGGQTALHVAKMDATSLVGFLDDTRMKELINVADNDCNTPLHLACINSNLDIADALLEVNGINWRLRNNDGCTPMDLCNSDDQISIKLAYNYFEIPRNQAQAQPPKGVLGKLVNMVSGEPIPMVVVMVKELRLYLRNNTYLEGLTEEELIQLFNNMALTATLLVTLTFGAAFTVPGGYDPATGKVLRMKQVSVRLFLGLDVTAMMMGMGSLLRYTFGITKGKKNLKQVAAESAFFLQLSLSATVAAFTVGIYALASEVAIEIFILTIVFAVFLFIYLLVTLNIWTKSRRVGPIKRESISSQVLKFIRSISCITWILGTLFHLLKKKICK